MKGGRKQVNEKKYEVLIDDKVVAERMDLTTATVLLKALFEEYYNDSFTVSVREMTKSEMVGDMK